MPIMDISPTESAVVQAWFKGNPTWPGPVWTDGVAIFAGGDIIAIRHPDGRVEVDVSHPVGLETRRRIPRHEEGVIERQGPIRLDS